MLPRMLPQHLGEQKLMRIGNLLEGEPIGDSVPGNRSPCFIALESEMSAVAPHCAERAADRKYDWAALASSGLRSSRIPSIGGSRREMLSDCLSKCRPVVLTGHDTPCRYP